MARLLKVGLPRGPLDWASLTVGKLLLFTCGWDYVFKWDGADFTKGPLLAPTAAPAINVTVADSLTFTKGGRKYVYRATNAKVRMPDQRSPYLSSNPSPESVATGNIVAKKPRVELPTSWPDRQVTHWEIFSTMDGGELFIYQDRVEVGTQYWYDETTEEELLGIAAQGGYADYNHLPPPPATCIIEHQGQTFYAGDLALREGFISVTVAQTLASYAGVDLRAGDVGRFVTCEGDTRSYVVASIDRPAETLQLAEAYEGETGQKRFELAGDRLQIAYSRPNLPLYCPAAYTTHIQEPGARITGLAAWRGDVIVLTTHRPYRLVRRGEEEWAPVPIPRQETDCLNHLSVAQGEGVLMYLGRTGLRALASGDSQEVSTKVRTSLAGISGILLKKSRAVYDDRNRKIWLFVAESDILPDVAYVLNLELPQKPWSRYTGYGVTAVTKHVNEAGESWVYIGQRGFIWRLDSGTNDGAGEGYTTSGTLTGATARTFTDSAASFLTAGQGLRGVPVTILDGAGAGQRAIIRSNTGILGNLEGYWVTVPSNGDHYAIGAIPFSFTTKRYHWDVKDVKQLLHLHWWMDNGVSAEHYLKVEVFADYDEQTPQDTGYVDLREDYVQLGIAGFGKHLWFRFSNADVDVPIKIRKIVAHYELQRARPGP